MERHSAAQVKEIVVVIITADILSNTKTSNGGTAAIMRTGRSIVDVVVVITRRTSMMRRLLIAQLIRRGREPNHSPFNVLNALRASASSPKDANPYPRDRPVLGSYITRHSLRDAKAAKAARSVASLTC